MATRKIQVALIFFIIKKTFPDLGIVDDVYENKKFYCEGASKHAFIVNSQIQCIHRCLRKNCLFFNYKNGKGRTENCEVFTGSSHCSNFIHKMHWIAIQLQVPLEVLIIGPYGIVDIKTV